MMPTSPLRSTAPADPLDVGPYHLEAFIAAGAMGEVWRARHRRLDHAVAIKVIIRETAHDGRFRDALRREIQAMAGLRHPGIAVILDHGVFSTGSARFARGSPFFAMELAAGGSLGAALTRRVEWPEAKAVFLAVLEALAHAHARGVVHRDLKPENVLDFAPPGSGAARWKLVDFGIAHSTEARAGSAEGLLGTPAYMAPEQFLGRWRDFGPGTDLYALGCIAYELLCGRRLYPGRTVTELAHQHLETGLPAFVPRVAVPPGVEAWLGRLLAKSVGDRFPYAADAAACLRELGAPIVVPTGDLSSALQKSVPATGPSTFAGTVGTVDQAASMDETLAGPDEAVLADAHSVPSGLDERWSANLPAALAARFTREAGRFAAPPRDPRLIERPVTDPAADALAASSIGLFGLRAAPFVGREAERAQVWAALKRVGGSGRPEALIIEGAAGAGKSRLAEWFAQQVAEIGAAQVLRATHGREGGSSSGIGPMLMRHYQCVGLTADEIRRRTLWLTRLAQGDDGWDLDALADLMLGDADGWSAATRGQAAGERFGALRKYLQIIGRERPVLVWLDDAHWSEESVGFVRFMLRWSGRARCPVLFMLTVRSEDLRSVPAVRGTLDEIAASDRAHRMRLTPFSQHEMQALIGGRLKIDPALAEEIARSSHGNPLFVVQLLGEWVGQGLLRATAAGLELQPGVVPRLPGDLHAVWVDRIEHLLDGLPVGDGLALQVAAVLGLRVARAEWQAACDAAHVHASEALIAAMVDRGLARWTPEGFAFAHGLLRESLVRIARQTAWIALNRSCAAALQALGGRRGLARLGRHLLEAGALEAAIAPLLDAARYAYGHAEIDEAFELLGRCDAAIERLGSPPDLAAAAWTLRGRICTHLGRREEAERFLERARAAADAAQVTSLYADALLASALHSRTWHEGEQAAQLAREALARFEAIGDRAGCGWSRVNLAHVLTNGPEAASAEAHYAAALADFEALGDRAGMGQCQRGLGWLRQAAGDAEAAGTLFALAHDNLQVGGHRLLAMAVVNDIADLHRAAGDLEAAEIEYGRALELFESVGHVNRLVVRLNLGMVTLERGRFEAAEAQATQLLAEVGADDYLRIAAHAQLLVCAAARGDRAGWDAHFAPVAEGLDDAAEVELDDAISVDLAARQAQASGLTDEARAAARIGRKLWTRLGRPEKSAALAAAVSGG